MGSSETIQRDCDRQLEAGIAEAAVLGMAVLGMGCGGGGEPILQFLHRWQLAVSSWRSAVAGQQLPVAAVGIAGLGSSHVCRSAVLRENPAGLISTRQLDCVSSRVLLRSIAGLAEAAGRVSAGRVSAGRGSKCSVVESL